MSTTSNSISSHAPTTSSSIGSNTCSVTGTRYSDLAAMEIFNSGEACIPASQDFHLSPRMGLFIQPLPRYEADVMTRDCVRLTLSKHQPSLNRITPPDHYFCQRQEGIATVLYGPLPLRQPDNETSTDHRDHDFRLLAVESLPADGALRCKMWTSSIEEAIHQDFLALSYAWGDASITEPMIVNGHAFQPTRNLVTALRDILSSVSGPLTAIWVDAICMNHVKPMGRICGCCKKALCSLGPEESDHNGINGKIICRFLDTLVHHLDNDTTMHPQEDEVMLKFLSLRDHSYRDINHGMDLDRERFNMAPIFNQRYDTYWSRVRTFREVVLAPRSKFITTKHEWCYLIRRREKIYLWLYNLDMDAVGSLIWMSLAADRDAPSPINDILWVRLRAIPVARCGKSKAADAGTKPGLLPMVGSIRERNATDARDKLFGAAGIADIGLDVDHSLSAKDLYIKFAITMLEKEARSKKSSSDSGVLFHAAGKLEPGAKVPRYHNAPAGNARLPLSVSSDGMTLKSFGVVLDVVKEALPLPRDVDQRPFRERMHLLATAIKFLCAEDGTHHGHIDSRTVTEDVLTEPPTRRTYGQEAIHHFATQLLNPGRVSPPLCPLFSTMPELHTTQVTSNHSFSTAHSLRMVVTCPSAPPVMAILFMHPLKFKLGILFTSCLATCR
ncbi:hypothetical protein V8F33_009153 [Rhypophila sp. PSN 637]